MEMDREGVALDIGSGWEVGDGVLELCMLVG